jgi:hypothetical protein
VVAQVAIDFGLLGDTVVTFDDETSKTQSENLKRIVDFHNAQDRDLDCSVHFNAFATTSKPMGTEVLWITQQALAARVSANIAKAGGFIDRGAKKRTNLYFLNNTKKPAILLEICFVDSQTDAELYKKNFRGICSAIAASVNGGATVPVEPSEPEDGIEAGWNEDITATVFGGATDPNKSAYPPYDSITDSELSVALPYRFVGPRPKVRVLNPANGKEVTCTIRDIGPWLINNTYWATRPLAETCFKDKSPLPDGPNQGKIPTNDAGIDLTPAAAKAIGISGKGKCSWAFALELDEGGTTV